MHTPWDIREYIYRFTEAIFDYHIPSPGALFMLVLPCCWTPKMCESPLEFCCYRVYSLTITWLYIHFQFMSAIFNLPHTLTWIIIHTKPIVLLDYENVEVGIRISLLSCILTEINLNFQFRVAIYDYSAIAKYSQVSYPSTTSTMLVRAQKLKILWVAAQFLHKNLIFPVVQKNWKVCKTSAKVKISRLILHIVPLLSNCLNMSIKSLNYFKAVQYCRYSELLTKILHVSTLTMRALHKINVQNSGELHVKFSIF